MECRQLLLIQCLYPPYLVPCSQLFKVVAANLAAKGHPEWGVGNYSFFCMGDYYDMIASASAPPATRFCDVIVDGITGDELVGEWPHEGCVAGCVVQSRRRRSCVMSSLTAPRATISSVIGRVGDALMQMGRLRRSMKQMMALRGVMMPSCFQCFLSSSSHPRRLWAADQRLRLLQRPSAHDLHAAPAEPVGLPRGEPPPHTTMFTQSHTFQKVSPPTHHHVHTIPHIHLHACPHIPLLVQPFETEVWLLTLGMTCPFPPLTHPTSALFVPCAAI